MHRPPIRATVTSSVPVPSASLVRPTAAQQTDIYPIRSSNRRARAALLCATCRRTIQSGEPYRRDAVSAPIFGLVPTSAICAACAEVGL